MGSQNPSRDNSSVSTHTGTGSTPIIVVPFNASANTVVVISYAVVFTAGLNHGPTFTASPPACTAQTMYGTVGNGYVTGGPSLPTSMNLISLDVAPNNPSANFLGMLYQQVAFPVTAIHFECQGFPTSPNNYSAVLIIASYADATLTPTTNPNVWTVTAFVGESGSSAPVTFTPVSGSFIGGVSAGPDAHGAAGVTYGAAFADSGNGGGTPVVNCSGTLISRSVSINIYGLTLSPITGVGSNSSQHPPSVSAGGTVFPVGVSTTSRTYAPSGSGSGITSVLSGVSCVASEDAPTSSWFSDPRFAFPTGVGASSAEHNPTTTADSNIGVTGVSCVATENAPIAGEFAVGVVPSSLTMDATDSVEIVVTYTSLDGFSDFIIPTITGVPSGMIASFSPALISGGAGVTTLTLTTTGESAGTFDLLVGGTGLDLPFHQTTPLTVIVDNWFTPRWVSV